MSKLIFEAKTRHDHSPQKYTEDSFSFCDRSAWQAIENVRHLLNDWASAYPEVEAGELISRFRTEFDAVFFELFIYTFFSRLNFELHPHPIMSHTTKRCDFKATDINGDFFLECITTNGLSYEEEGRKNTEHLFYDFINEMNCPGFYLKLVEVNFKGAGYPAFKKIRQYLEQEINAIDPDTIPIALIREFKNLPALIHDDPKFRLTLQLVPKPLEAREKKTRAIGVFTTKFHNGGFGHVLADAIKRKAGKYGRIPAPFMIAINALTELPIDDYDIEDALFGGLMTNRVPLILKGEYVIPATVESSFFAFGKPVHTRVSAVLVTRVNPTNLAHAKYWIYYHPMAAKELDLDRLNLASYRINSNGIHIMEGRSIKEVLDVPYDWPGEKK
jgi:hypothetical protein